jgi:diadenosine tetraphosphatase ApaH/serine/threonine PP2A family protein phosphatase
LSHPLTAILSDLHANEEAVQTAVADARERGAQRFVCLGDVVGYGARPRECLDVVMELIAGDGNGIAPGLCLQGNHEHALLSNAEDFNPRARAAIEWTRDVLNAAERERSYAYWDFLGSLKPRVSEELSMYAHGSPRDPVREYLLPSDVRNPAKMAANFDAMDAPVCFVGHSHVPAIYRSDNRHLLPRGTTDVALNPSGLLRIIVNVGSVGQPRDGDVRLSYALWDGRTVTFVRLDYDVDGAMQKIRAVPELPDYLADRLAVGR